MSDPGMLAAQLPSVGGVRVVTLNLWGGYYRCLSPASAGYGRAATTIRHGPTAS